MNYEAVIGLEIHAELQTKSKMFCGCKVVDPTTSKPNSSVCPVCMGLPGVLPVTNKKAVEFGVKVALALSCEINLKSIFARKNYFYPDLPKGYQISQYEEPLARNGKIRIQTSQSEREIRVRRVHLEEDTGKLTHETKGTLIDLNRAGIPLLEIVSEPDIHTAEEARSYAENLRSILMYLKVSSGDMQKGVLRIEPNVSIRPAGSNEFGIRTEIKNLNSFRALERGIAFEIKRQQTLLEQGEKVAQETVGWDEERQITFAQRVKEGEEDYRYFPEPDLPPLDLNPKWIEELRNSLPELPAVKRKRFQDVYGLTEDIAGILVQEFDIANYFEAVVSSAPEIDPRQISNWITGELFSLMNETGENISNIKVSPDALTELLTLINKGTVNLTTGKLILMSMFDQGCTAMEIMDSLGLRQISDLDQITSIVLKIIKENPNQVSSYLGGKEGLFNWFFGQVMKATQGKANPNIIREVLKKNLI